MKQLLLAMVLLLLGTFAWAALSDYTFQSSPATYAEITAPTVIHGPGIDDSMSPVFDIGFNFLYDEVVYTQFKANSNGFITLNPTSSASLTNALATTPLIIGALWDDLMTNAGDGAVAYQLSGTSPSQVLTIQFKNMKWYYSTTNIVNFQIKLYQGSNNIEFCYGVMSPTAGTSASASIGLSGAIAGNFMSITPGTTASSSTTTEFNTISGMHCTYLEGQKYTFLAPMPANNDLAATAVSGNTTPSVGTPTAYTVTVYNRGSNAQNTYTVKLINAANQELASVAGTAVAAGATAQVSLPWTPTVQGPVALRGKVVLAGDENTANDISNALNVTVMPEGMMVVTIGDGAISMREPLDFFFMNSLNETLFFPAEIGMFGNLSAMTLYNNFTQTLANMPVKVWVGTTDLADLSGGWIPSTQLTLVYDGPITFPSGENSILIPFQTVFSYTGGNLVVMCNRPMDTQYYSSSNVFKGQNLGTNRSRNVYSDGTVYDPANPGTVGTLSGNYAKTSLHMTPLSPNPIFSITPSSKNYGSVLMNTTHNQTFTVMNAGGGTLTVSAISLAGSPYFSLQNMPTLPATLATGQTITFVGRYNPTVAGAHTGTISITDNRMVHTVALSGTSVDTNIYALPYTQNFDAVTVPALPIDWSSLITPAGSAAVVATYASAPYSTPNCVQIYNGYTTATDVFLVAPPLAPAIPVNTARLKLMVKGSGTLLIGVMTDPLNAATFTQVQSVTVTSAWSEIAVNFNGFTGPGNFIAIKHGNASSYQTIYVDNAIIEVIAANDLACTLVTGNTTPSVGNATTYTASILNWGTNAQSTYTVKLFSSTGTELATAPGVTCAPGATVSVPIIWTPTVEGPTSIYGKVFLTTDPNPANDQSPNLGVTVMPAGMMVVTVGEGNQTLRMPLDFYYRNSLNETLYFPTELGMYGNITAVSLYNQFVTTTLTSMPTKIWMGTTQQNDLSAGWIPSTQLTLVFDGNVSYPAGTNTITIPLQTMFTYTGGNLVMLSNRPMDTVYYSSSDVFLGQTVGTNRARNAYSDSETYDPTTPGTIGSVTGQFAKTTFYMTAIGPDPIYLVNPASKDFGTCLINTTQNQTFTVMNVGGGALNVSAITIAGSPFYSLQNLPALPVSLTTGQTATFIGRYNPTAVGTHAAMITVTDNRGNRQELVLGSRENGNRLPHTIALTGNCIDTTVNALPYAQNFDGVTAPALPVDWTSLISPPSGTAAVVTYATTPNSAPNCLRIYNGSTTASSVLLVAPPLNVSIPMNTTRMKVWIKGASSTYTLSVGVMTDPLNPATFSQVQTITTPTAWTEFVIPFNGYTGAGRYIAFMHGNAGTGQAIYVDNVIFELIAPNDLGASLITGNLTPTAGAEFTYTVSVLNWGTNAQSAYSVKIFDSANNELATAAGIQVVPGQTVQVPVLWTPAAAGAISIYGKVVLAGDQNTGNDQSPSINLLVQPAGVWNITVGDGSQTAQIPVNMYWRNSLFETLYYPAELDGFIGQILGLQFYNNFYTNNPNGATKIWLGTTTQTDLSAGWIPSTELTLVFDGVVTYPAGQNTITIPFAVPYMYLNGENIVMMVNRPMDTVYYSSQDYFAAQTVGSTRARTIYSDSTLFDPAAPPDGSTNSGQFPKTTFIIIPGGVGHINGTVTGVGGVPLPGVSVQLASYSATTNAQGHYSIQNILPNTYTANFSVYGYQNASQTITIEEDETEVLNVNMTPMATVNVTGIVQASDTAAGISGASIHLDGYADYDANSIASGAFTIPSVYANQPYSYIIMAPGYTSLMGTINVGATNHNMGTMLMNEIAYAPHSVLAQPNTQGIAVDLTWEAPDPNAIEVTESFEAEVFPPTNWTQTITNIGPPNTTGVKPTWCRVGAFTISGQPVTPTEGSYQGGLWWDYAHQDEWLITPSFNCPPGGYLRFDSHVFLGSTNGDHYYVKVSPDNGNTWTILWDASAQTGGWNYYASPITVDLNLYGGQQIKLAFHATDGPSDDGLWYVWFIDDIYIGNALTAQADPAQTIRFSTSELISRSASRNGLTAAPATTANPSRTMQIGGTRAEPRLPFPWEIRYTSNDQRPLTGYKIWRLTSGQEGNEPSWSLITPTALDLAVHNFTDPAWQTLPNGEYRWAVRGLYSNGVTSVPSFSNILVKVQETGNIAGVVRRQNTVPIQGATVSAAGFTATTNGAGAYTLVMPVGMYDVTCSAPGFGSQTIQNVLVNVNQTTTQNFIMLVSDDDDNVIPVTATALLGNYPNPFNPETIISYSVKEAAPVRIEIFNSKGQKVRTLVNELQSSGWYDLVWNGKDDNGRAVSSGVYLYRMSAGAYHHSRKMILMQ